ncbi:MAG: hypothetical protein WCK37_01045 [Candidatus Falkowbacteria bacterium]
MDKNGLSQGIDLNKFEDSEGITLNKMNIGLWLVAHRRRFILIFIGFLIAMSAIFYGYTIYGYVDYLFFGGQRERLAIEELTKTPSVSEEQRLQAQAKPIETSVPQAFANAGNYDFLAKINNPNDKFFVSFDYCFTDSGKDLACAKTFLLPSENTYVAVFNSTSTVQSQLGFRMFNTKWERLNLHIYPDWKSFASDHINFSTSDINFKSSQDSGLSEKISLNSLDFKVSNNSAYNFWEAPFTILMFNGPAVVAINHYTLSSFMSGEIRPIKISWAGSVAAVNKLEVYPEINILNDSVFMKYK